MGDNAEITVLDEKDKEGSLTEILPRNEFADTSRCGKCGSGFCDFCHGRSGAKFPFAGQIPGHDGTGGDSCRVVSTSRTWPGGDESGRLAGVYRDCGYQVICASARDGSGPGGDQGYAEGKPQLWPALPASGSRLLPICFRIRCRWRREKSAGNSKEDGTPPAIRR